MSHEFTLEEVVAYHEEEASYWDKTADYFESRPDLMLDEINQHNVKAWRKAAEEHRKDIARAKGELK